MRTISVLVSMLLLLGCDAAPMAQAEDGPPVAPPAPPTTERTLVVNPIGGVVQVNWTPDFSGFAGTSTGCMRSYGAGRFAVPLTFAEGDRMLSLVVAMIGNFSADLDVTSVAVAPNGDRFLGTVGNLDFPNVPDTWSDAVIDLVDTTIEAGVTHWFEFETDQAGLCIGAVRLTYDHP